MGEFIVLQVDRGRCLDGATCARCVDVCPVDIFRLEDGELAIDTEQEDECILCELCLQTCPQEALRLIKLYED